MNTHAALLLAAVTVFGAFSCGGNDDEGGAGGTAGGSGGQAGSDAAVCPTPTQGTAEMVKCAATTVDQTVTIQGNSYDPSTVSANVGEVIQFAPLEGFETFHTATAGPPGCIGEWDIRPTTGDCLRVLAAGTYPFHCEFHLDMTGELVVSP